MTFLRVSFFLSLSLAIQLTSTAQQVFSVGSKNKLNEISKREADHYKESLEKAKEICLQRNIPTSLEMADGRTAYIFGVTETYDLLYVLSDNQRESAATRTSSLNTNGKLGLSLNGENLTVGIWEVGLPNLDHQEFAGRVQQLDGDAGIGSSERDHATHVIGTVAATGLNELAKGMASLSQVDSYSSSADASEMAEAAANGLLISNHSYGFIRGWSDGEWQGNSDVSAKEDYLFGFYDNQARVWDDIAVNAPNYLIVKSAGNERGDSGTGFPEDCNEGEGFDCISHGGISKNVLTIGAANVTTTNPQQRQDVTMSSFSSWGPADDGRIKPDLVGMGVNVLSSIGPDNDDYGSLSGTSMASPNVAGSLILLQEYYFKLKSKYLLSSTVKGIVIHTALDAGLDQGPDYAYGWGLLDVEKAAIQINRSMNEDSFILKEDTLFQSAVTTYSLPATQGKKVAATICWIDPAGIPTQASLDPANRMLINDLDIRIISPSGLEFFPWKLSRTEPSAAATKGDNQVDNVEKIEFDAPEDGIYSIVVSHKSTLAASFQVFSLIANAEPITDLASETFFWIGVDGDWESPMNWSTTRGGVPADRIPSENIRVIIPDLNTSNESRNISVSNNIKCYSLTIEGEDNLTISLGNHTLTVKENIVIRNSNFNLLGDGTILLQNSQGSTSIIEIVPALPNARLEISSEASTYNVISDLFFKTVKLTSGTLSIRDNKTLFVDSIYAQNNFQSKRINFVNGIIDSAIFVDLSAPALVVNSESIQIKIRESEESLVRIPDIQKVKIVNASDSLILDTGELETLQNYGRLLILHTVDVAELTLENGSELYISDQSILSILSQFTINSNESAVSISAFGALAFINVEIESERRLCFTNLKIQNVESTGITMLVAGISSQLVGNVDGWVVGNCESILFADFTMQFPCAEGITYFKDLSSGAPVTWLWNFGDVNSGIDNLSTEQNPEHVYSTPGFYNVILKVSDGLTEKEFEKTIEIITNTLVKPEILLSSGFVFSSKFFSNFYQWYLDEEIIEGANSRFLTMGNPGVYQLEIRDQFCSSFSDPFLITDVESLTNDEINIYPNPTKSLISVYFEDKRRIDEITLQSSTGIMVSLEGRVIQDENRSQIMVAGFPSGLYLLKIEAGNKKFTRKILVE